MLKSTPSQTQRIKSKATKPTQPIEVLSFKSHLKCFFVLNPFYLDFNMKSKKQILYVVRFFIGLKALSLCKINKFNYSKAIYISTIKKLKSIDLF